MAEPPPMFPLPEAPKPPPNEGPPEAIPPAAEQPAPIYPPGFAAAPTAAPTAAERMIPTKNPKALTSYYSGCFSVVICFAPILGPLAIILGILGLKECKKNPQLPGKGHAITGIILGGITTLIVLVIAGLAIWASMNQPNSG